MMSAKQSKRRQFHANDFSSPALSHCARCPQSRYTGRRCEAFESDRAAGRHGKGSLSAIRVHVRLIMMIVTDEATKKEKERDRERERERERTVRGGGEVGEGER